MGDGYYKRRAGRFDAFGKEARRRPLARNHKGAESSYMPFNEVMVSYHTFVRINKLEESAIKSNVVQFCNKYERVASYKDLIIKMATEDLKQKEQKDVQE